MLEINSIRLLKTLDAYSQIGATPNGGVHRLALSEEDFLAKRKFEDDAKKLGARVIYDPVGNQYAIFEGSNENLKPILISSHLDSQPTGGKYDGSLGVLCGLEAIHSIKENSLMPHRSIHLVNWMNEEGARFNPAMMGSGYFINEFSERQVLSTLDVEDLSVEYCLNQNKAFKGEHKPSFQYFQCYELHIEQGPILEINEKNIGVVSGVQGIQWLDIHIKGQEMHAGPFPMSSRRDPVKIAAHFLSDLYTSIEKISEAKLTVGFVKTLPAVKNTVPGECILSIDIRHPNQDMLIQLRKLIDDKCSLIPLEYQVTINDIWTSEPVSFHEACQNEIKKATMSLGLSHQNITSGAGHDSVYLSKKFPTGMIFVPCIDGLSHNEKENIHEEDAINGANVLLQILLQTCFDS